MLLLFLHVCGGGTADAAGSRGSPAAAALRLLESGDSESALSLLRSAANDPAKDSAQVQAALGVAALQLNHYEEAERASKRAVRLKPGRRGASIARAAQPVRGAALLNLGRFKDAAKVFSKLLKTGGDARFHLDMHSVKLFARAKSEGLGDHEKAGKDLLKYCKSRFSPKRRSRSERRGSALEAFDCFETAGVAFTRAGRADQAAAAFDMALRIPDAKSQDFRSNFAPGS